METKFKLNDSNSTDIELTKRANLSYFNICDQLGFYLQDSYVKPWVENTMLFLEVDDVERYWKELNTLNLEAESQEVRLSSIRHESWGKECFLHDPAGILSHFGEFRVL